MAISRLQIAKKDILDFFETKSPHVLKYKEISSFLELNRNFWRLAQRTNTRNFIEFLSKTGKLKTITFSFPVRSETRYVWGQQNLTDILLTIGNDSYFSHFTAMQMHGMTDQIPKTIYINHEQNPREKDYVIKQENIDNAFEKLPRISSNIASYKDVNICLLNGQYTNQIGVIDDYVTFAGKKVKVRVTNIERTLIDITVRPSYAGGVFDVLKAYENIKESVSVNSMSAILKEIEYIYPYHQAVGFYLERAGYPTRDLNLIKKIPMEHDFYLTNKMENKEYIKNWKLYVPSGF